jgi:hypothetical protein
VTAPSDKAEQQPSSQTEMVEQTRLFIDLPGTAVCLTDHGRVFAALDTGAILRNRIIEREILTGPISSFVRAISGVAIRNKLT